MVDGDRCEWTVPQSGKRLHWGTWDQCRGGALPQRPVSCSWSSPVLRSNTSSVSIKGLNYKNMSVLFFAFDRMMSSRITLYSTYTALCFVQMVFCCRSLGRSSPCWIEPSPGWTAWIRRRIAGRRCPPAALLWTPALHCTQPAAWPASLRTPVEGAEHRHINHLVLIQFV